MNHKKADIAMAEAIQNPAKLFRLAEECGEVIITKHEKPAFVLKPMEEDEPGSLSEKKSSKAAGKILESFSETFETLD